MGRKETRKNDKSFLSPSISSLTDEKRFVKVLECKGDEQKRVKQSDRELMGGGNKCGAL